MTGLSTVRMISNVGGRWTVRTGSGGQPTVSVRLLHVSQVLI
jgi:hypothetical protein